MWMRTGWRETGDKRFSLGFRGGTVRGLYGGGNARQRGAGSPDGGRLSGVLSSDRFSAYLKYHAAGTAQFCRAPLKRNLLAIVEIRDER
jgi:hypothetical protein